MPVFIGFPAGKTHLTPVPAQFFSELLPMVDHLGELKVTLYAFWYLDQLETPVRFLTHTDFSEEESLVKSLQCDLDDALDRAVKRGSFLKVLLKQAQEEETYYFLNTPRGRAAVESIQKGQWAPLKENQPITLLEAARPNIFALYEENIGPLTPMIADMLRDAEKTYRQEWLAEAITLAVRNNVRRWNYIEAILRSWQERGRDGADRQTDQTDYGRYTEGEFSEYIHH